MNLENGSFYYKVMSILDRMEREHPYLISFIISIIIISFMMFYASPLEIVDDDVIPPDSIQFIDLDSIESRATRRVAKKEFSTTEGDVSPADQVERATGTSDDPNAVDLAFYPNIARPKPIGNIKKIYPKIAEARGVEAMVNLEILISSVGKVKNVNVLRIILMKQFPPDLHSQIAKAFARAAVKTLSSVRFTPPIVNGKQAAIKMEMSLRFRLED